MTKRAYFVVVNVAENKPLQKQFFQGDTHSDIAGYITSCAEAWGIDVSDVRMFMYATKRDWEAAAIEYAQRNENDH